MQHTNLTNQTERRQKGLARGLLLLTVVGAMALPLVPVVSATTHIDSAQYVSGLTGVAKANQATVDQGGVVCESINGNGVGGVCLDFDSLGAVRVTDLQGTGKIAFQVCIDNDQNNICALPDQVGASANPACLDTIVFSHHDSGAFNNAITGLPTSLPSGCGSSLTAWQGYVVFLCEGVHAVGTPHVHPATTGVAEISNGGTVDTVAGPGFVGSGAFCGSPPSTPGKPYAVVPPQGVPTLSQWGIVGMVAALGGIGVLAISRRSK